jgi:hypothetical protein
MAAGWTRRDAGMRVCAATIDLNNQLSPQYSGAAAPCRRETSMQSLDRHDQGLTGTAAAKRLTELSDHHGRISRATAMKVE